MLEFAANELLFIKTLLNAKAFQDTKGIRLTEMLRFKLGIKTKDTEINNLKAEVVIIKYNVGYILESGETSKIKFSFESYKTLKHNFSQFNTSYSQYKAEIFKHTGGVL